MPVFSQCSYVVCVTPILLYSWKEMSVTPHTVAGSYFKNGCGYIAVTLCSVREDRGWAWYIVCSTFLKNWFQLVQKFVQCVLE